MSSLFRSLQNFSNKKETSVKEALISTFNENVRDIQYELTQTGHGNFGLCESTSALCTTLEAIFLHGLKDSLLWQTISAISDVERRPEPSFWPPLLVFLHKQVIEQLQSLSQITTEIGLCRAWIRQSLNESLVSSYLINIRKNKVALNPYYKRYAFLKDAEGLETVENVLNGIESLIRFDLPVNSSLLNQWPDYSLQLSGLWTPPLKSCPVSSAIDVACSMPSDALSIPTPQPVSTNELFSESISNSPFNSKKFTVEDLSQRESLDLFLKKVDEMDVIVEENLLLTNDSHVKNTEKNKSHKDGNQKVNDRSEPSVKDTSDKIIDSASRYEDNPSLQHIHGNSLSNLMQTSWSSGFSQEPESGISQGRSLVRSVSLTSSTSSLRSPIGDHRCSYNTLLKKHERNRQVDWTEIWEKFLLQNTNAGDDENFESDKVSNDSEPDSDFELIHNNFALGKFDVVELQELVEQLCKLAREPGLDTQGFLCKSCQHPLGIGYTNIRVCAFSGHYYCDDCMDVEPVFIPARIIYNWDFRKYRISKQAKAFLTEFRCQPFIDLKLLNPIIYNAAEAMAELQSLRIRLNFLRAYLYTCEPASIKLFQQQFFGKEYLYEHIHVYSVSDLASIQQGSLYQKLQKAYKIGEQHVLKCGLCRVKGFICEICNSPRVLYPFHIDTTFRCATCGAVFHSHCLNSLQPCPKCERKRKRIDDGLH